MKKLLLSALIVSSSFFIVDSAHSKTVRSHSIVSPEDSMERMLKHITDEKEIENLKILILKRKSFEFNQLDVNNNGSLSPAELVGLRGFYAEDDNKDGDVSFQEFFNYRKIIKRTENEIFLEPLEEEKKIEKEKEFDWDSLK